MMTIWKKKKNPENTINLTVLLTFSEAGATFLRGTASPVEHSESMTPQSLLLDVLLLASIYFTVTVPVIRPRGVRVFLPL
jgi:hypothetical protein